MLTELKRVLAVSESEPKLIERLRPTMKDCYLGVVLCFLVELTAILEY